MPKIKKMVKASFKQICVDRSAEDEILQSCSFELWKTHQDFKTLRGLDSYRYGCNLDRHNDYEDRIC